MHRPGVFKGLCAALLLLASSVAFGAPPPRIAFEFFAVSGSSQDVPALLVGTSELEDSLNIQICDALDRGLPQSIIAKQLGLGASELKTRIDALTHAELLRSDTQGRYAPTFPIIHRTQARWFEDIDRPLIDATVRAIEARQQQFRSKFGALFSLDGERQRALSLILFGDTLFDRWQTKNVRKEFLGGYPPARDGKQFYLAALEKVPGKIASLGIYTHAEPRYGAFTVVNYGHTVALDPFAAEKPEDVVASLSRWSKDGGSAFTMVSSKAYAALPEITNAFAPELLRLLNADRGKISAAHAASRYGRSVSFPEFALWWYHFFDAAVVDRLVRDGVISVPASGYATMIVTPDGPA
jgi:hypothetical protein